MLSESRLGAKENPEGFPYRFRSQVLRDHSKSKSRLGAQKTISQVLPLCVSVKEFRGEPHKRFDSASWKFRNESTNRLDHAGWQKENSTSRIIDSFETGRTIVR